VKAFSQSYYGNSWGRSYESDDYPEWASSSTPPRQPSPPDSPIEDGEGDDGSDGEWESDDGEEDEDE